MHLADSVPTDISGLVTRLRRAGCVFAEDEADLLVAAATTAGELETLVARRISGTPLEQVLGWAEFRGLRVTVAPGVFVPRQRTGYLVERAVALGRGEQAVVLDLCCGSGALGLAVGTELAATGSTVRVIATDIDPAATDCARHNLAGLSAAVYAGDLFDPLPHDLAGRVTILLANVPYVPSAQIARMPPEAREHEPRSALDGGPDGLAIFRRVVAAAPDWLAPGGHLLSEIAPAQTDAALGALERHGLTARVDQDEEIGATIVLGTRPTAS